MNTAGMRMAAKSVGNSRFFRSHTRSVITLGVGYAGLQTAASAAGTARPWASQAYRDLIGGTAGNPREYHDPYWLGTKNGYLENDAPMGATGGLALAAHKNRLKY